MVWMFQRAKGLVDKLKGPEKEKDRKIQQRISKTRRTQIVCSKLFFNVVFLFSWSYIILDQNTYYTGNSLLGWGIWTDVSVYAGVSCGTPLFSFVGLLREASLVSQVWFEIMWLLLISGFDTYLVWRQIAFWPPFSYWSQNYFDDPYLTISIVLYVLTVVALCFDLALSLLWVILLGSSAFANRKKYPRVWMSQAKDLPWLVSQDSKVASSPQGIQFIIGTPPSGDKTIPQSFKDWILGHTMFRKFGEFEPISYCLLRGVVALLCWIILLAFGILNCVINPIRQFTLSQGLPTNYLMRESRPTNTFGEVHGFVTLGVIPASSEVDESWAPSNETVMAILQGISANYTYGGQVGTCDPSYGWNYMWNTTGFQGIELEAQWLCPAIWDILPFRTAPTAPDQRPIVTVTWDSAAFASASLLTAGVASMRVTPKTNETEVVGGFGNPREWKHGVTFNLTAGETVQANVGRRRFYANRATFLDLIGIAQYPDVYVTYPINSLTDSTASAASTLTTIRFYPAFGAYDDELYEEYLDFTVISGLSATGGLYTAFEVGFMLIFGRSLLAALFGGKHVTPFGALVSFVQRNTFRQNLLKGYPGIEEQDPAKSTQATCNFMRDFLLDMKPLEVQPSKPRPKAEEEPAKERPSDTPTDEKRPEEFPTLSYNDLESGRNTPGKST